MEYYGWDYPGYPTRVLNEVESLQAFLDRDLGRYSDESIPKRRTKKNKNKAKTEPTMENLDSPNNLPSPDHSNALGRKSATTGGGSKTASAAGAPSSKAKTASAPEASSSKAKTASAPEASSSKAKTASAPRASSSKAKTASAPRTSSSKAKTASAPRTSSSKANTASAPRASSRKAKTASTPRASSSKANTSAPRASSSKANTSAPRASSSKAKTSAPRASSSKAKTNAPRASSSKASTASAPGTSSRKTKTSSALGVSVRKAKTELILGALSSKSKVKSSASASSGKSKTKSPLVASSGKAEIESPLVGSSGKSEIESPLVASSGKSEIESPLVASSGKSEIESPLVASSGKSEIESPLVASPGKSEIETFASSGKSEIESHLVASGKSETESPLMVSSSKPKTESPGVTPSKPAIKDKAKSKVEVLNPPRNLASPGHSKFEGLNSGASKSSLHRHRSNIGVWLNTPSTPSNLSISLTAAPSQVLSKYGGPVARKKVPPSIPYELAALYSSRMILPPKRFANLYKPWLQVKSKAARTDASAAINFEPPFLFFRPRKPISIRSGKAKPNFVINERYFTSSNASASLGVPIPLIRRTKHSLKPSLKHGASHSSLGSDYSGTSSRGSGAKSDKSVQFCLPSEEGNGKSSDKSGGFTGTQLLVKWTHLNNNLGTFEKIFKREFPDCFFVRVVKYAKEVEIYKTMPAGPLLALIPDTKMDENLMPIPWHSAPTPWSKGRVGVMNPLDRSVAFLIDEEDIIVFGVMRA